MALAPGPTIRASLADLRRLDLLLDEAAAPPHAASRLKPGARSGNGAAVSGAEGFLFIGDGANRWEQQYLNEQPMAESWLAGWLGVLDGRQAEAERRGVELWNLVIPEKQAVLPQMRWPKEAFEGARRPWRQLEARLAPEHRVRYAAADLLAGHAAAPAFIRHNSHWTPSGCCAAVQGLLGAVGVAASLEDLPLIYANQVLAHDLTRHFFDPAPTEDSVWLHPAQPFFFDNQAFERTGRYTGASYGIRNPEAPDPRRVMVFGDSYSYDVGLTFALSAVFAETVFTWSKAVLWEEVERHRSQIVVWESAERFLTSLPEA